MLTRRSLLTLTPAIFAPKAYSFIGGWSLPFAFAELDDGTILELVKRPAVRVCDVVMPEGPLFRDSEPVSGDNWFIQHPSEDRVMGYAGCNKKEAAELLDRIVHARHGDIERWWPGGLGQHLGSEKQWSKLPRVWL
jgi:hypothetical protein